jgi:hypothetical protein
MVYYGSEIEDYRGWFIFQKSLVDTQYAIRNTCYVLRVSFKKVFASLTDAFGLR